MLSYHNRKVFAAARDFEGVLRGSITTGHQGREYICPPITRSDGAEMRRLELYGQGANPVLPMWELDGPKPMTFEERMTFLKVLWDIAGLPTLSWMLKDADLDFDLAELRSAMAEIGSGLSTDGLTASEMLAEISRVTDEQYRRSEREIIEQAEKEGVFEGDNGAEQQAVVNDASANASEWYGVAADIVRRSVHIKWACVACC